METKKIIARALCMACVITALAGCGKEGNQEDTPTGQPQVTKPGELENPAEEENSGDEQNLTEGANSGEEQNPAEITESDKFQEMEEKIIYENGALSVKQEREGWSFTNGQMRLEYNAKEGTAQIFTATEELPLLSEVCAKVALKDGTELVSKNLKREGEGSIAVETIADGFGEGMQIRISNIGEEADVAQCYYFYPELPYFLCEAVAEAKEGEEISTNYIAPIYACKGDFKTNVLSLEGEDPRFLFVPYDNDAFIRYASQPLIAAAESYEVTAVFDNTGRKGFVAGSVAHDTWKTGIRVRQGGIDATVEFTVYGGANSAITRDSLPHGYVSGKAVASPKIFFGFFDDYRDGMEVFGQANAVIAPPLAWDKGIPMGWNSWSAVADKVSYDVYVNSSDFVKENLQENSFSENGIVYINFDSFWDNLTEKQLKEAAQHVLDNGQIPGIYMTPFTFWGGGYTAGTVPGTNNQYSWQDIVLKDENGTILPAVDGGVSIDPTHPGTVMNLEYQLNRFKEWGFAYVKMDFMSHGAREGVFYNPEITTGTQAYNYGMQKIHEILAEELEKQEFFISFSIAPIFPGQYAHSRRISCDVFGTIDQTEYMLNSLTYGWWINGTIYPFNDPDHIVVYNSFNHKSAILYNEGLSRYISAAITGTMLIDSDDFRIKEARNRAIEILTNEEINAVAKRGVAFRPVEGNTRDAACDTFISYEESEDALYLAVFNFDGSKKKKMQLKPERLGLEAGTEYEMYDLWSKETVEIAGDFEVSLDKAEPKIFRITRKEK